MIRIYAESSRAQDWIRSVIGKRPLFCCVLGFTETGLIPGISAAGATSVDRQYTAIADAEFLYHGPALHPTYPLPPLQAGASPVFITRAVTAGQAIPVQIINAGLPHSLTVPCLDFGGQSARCLTTGRAMDAEVVERLFQTGLEWGDRFGKTHQAHYLILGECVVGGTTTALAVLTALGWPVDGMVNSSHPTCNHGQKRAVVVQGIRNWRHHQEKAGIAINEPVQILAGVGDPMQGAIAGIALAASQHCKVMLAGGTQMLAVYALMIAMAKSHIITWQPDNIIVGTTRWVAEDPTGDTATLARLLKCPLAATQLSFATSSYPALRAYEQGFVKEGVGAGGCAIAAHLYQSWKQQELLTAIEKVATEYARVRQ